MAVPSHRLIVALRGTAARLARSEVRYQWASFAHCNCGHLAQSITGLAPEEIQKRAMRGEGDWGGQARDGRRGFPEFDYGDRPALDEGAWEPHDIGACQATGAPLDEVLAEMYDLGLTPADVGHLERLSDIEVRRRMGNHTQHFAHHDRSNVIAYLGAWADLLEDQLRRTNEDDGFLEAAE